MFYYITDSNLNVQSARVAISGPDAYTYLQGQFTQDLNRPIGAISYGLWLNQKGRPIAESMVARCGETDFLILSRHSSGAVLCQRLQDYLVADEVEVRDESAGWVWLAIFGPGAVAAVAKELASELQPGRWSGGDGVLAFMGRERSGENLDCWLRRDRVAAWRVKLEAWGAREVSGLELERQRILAGVPVVPQDIGPGDLPNEGGLEVTAISYTKGCYLGQEVMARLKNLGQVRRRLHVVRGEGGLPAAGAAVCQGGRRVGELRSLAPDGGGWVGLALLTLLNLKREAGLALSESGPADIAIVQDV